MTLMSSKATLELDFFHMGKQKVSRSPAPEQNGPLRGIQGLVSRINPQILKTVMAARGATTSAATTARPDPKSAGDLGFQSDGRHPFFPIPSNRGSSPRTVTGADRPSRRSLPPLPALDPTSRPASGTPPETGPLTIFYNGTVTAFDVPRAKAEAIMKLAESGNVRLPGESPAADTPFDDSQLEGDLPVARRKSLRRFLEKRKERYKMSEKD